MSKCWGMRLRTRRWNYQEKGVDFWAGAVKALGSWLG